MLANQHVLVPVSPCLDRPGYTRHFCPPPWPSQSVVQAPSWLSLAAPCSPASCDFPSPRGGGGHALFLSHAQPSRMPSVFTVSSHHSSASVKSSALHFPTGLPHNCISTGYNTGAIASAVLYIPLEFALNALYKGLLVSSVLLGAMLGAAMCIFFSEKIGRRRSLLSSNIFYISGVSCTCVPLQLESRLPFADSVQCFFGLCKELFQPNLHLIPVDFMVKASPTIQTWFCVFCCLLTLKWYPPSQADATFADPMLCFLGSQ